MSGPKISYGAYGKTEDFTEPAKPTPSFADYKAKNDAETNSVQSESIRKACDRGKLVKDAIRANGGPLAIGDMLRAGLLVKRAWFLPADEQAIGIAREALADATSLGDGLPDDGGAIAELRDSAVKTAQDGIAQSLATGDLNARRVRLDLIQGFGLSQRHATRLREQAHLAGTVPAAIIDALDTAARIV